MSPAPQNYTKAGFDYRQVLRDGNFAIYEQKLGVRLVAYELVRIRRQEAGTRVLSGKPITFEASERLPSSNAWGKDGWTFSLFGGRVPATEAFSDAKARLVLEKAKILSNSTPKRKNDPSGNP